MEKNLEEGLRKIGEYAPELKKWCMILIKKICY